MKPTMSRNAVSERDGEHGERALARLLEQRRRDALEDEVDADPERAHPALVELARSAPRCAATLPFSRMPAVSMTQRRSRKRVGSSTSIECAPGDLAVERARAAAQQREPEILLGDEITEDQRRRGGLHRSESLTVRVPGVKAPATAASSRGRASGR